jgi:hypothetical protein
VDRRAFLGRLALVATFALDTTGFAAALGRSPAPQREAWLPPLKDDERRLIDALAEGILPASDTPGARAAKVPEFIALLFDEWMLVEEQQSFRTGLAGLASDCAKTQGKAFDACTAEHQLSLLERWDREAMSAAPDAPRPFFRRFKNLVVTGYYTSQVGQEEELKVQFGAGQDVSAGPIMRPPPFTV